MAGAPQHKLEQAALRKKQLRAHYLEVRKNLPAEERALHDAQIHQQLEGFAPYQQAQLLLPYVSYSTEINTHPIIESALAAGKRVAVPRCGANHQMGFFEIASWADLVPGYKGILEPAPHLQTPLAPQQMQGALCLVPGLAFDARGFRIGYGGGYYDRFLANFTGAKVALARPSQLSEEPIPTDQYDIAIDYVVTPSKIISF